MNLSSKDRRKKLNEIFGGFQYMIDMFLSKEDEDMFLGIHPSGHNYDPKDFKAIIEILKKEPMKRISGKKYEN